MHERQNALKEWLSTTISCSDFSIKPLAGDASFRRYFRIQYNGLSQVVMDAPPDKEDLEPFMMVAQLLSDADICIPKVLASNKELGFLLLDDLGDELLLAKLTPTSVSGYYQQAIATIVQMQTEVISTQLLPHFDKVFMIKEMDLCPQWFLQGYLALELSADDQKLLQRSIEWIATEVAAQPLTFIHRDYHSRNLMLVGTHDARLGVIDFQDAMLGPITYDLVSLLKDCYISWPRDKLLQWVEQFYNLSSQAQQFTLAEFIRAFDLCGVQRHIKVLGVFSRLYLRDHKSGYLADLPRVLEYVLTCCALYTELHPLRDWLQQRVDLP